MPERRQLPVLDRAIDFTTAQHASGQIATGGTSANLLPSVMTITVNDSATPNHLLSDDQLDVFTDLAKDTSRDWFLWLAAIAVGTLQNAWYTVDALYENRVPTVFDGVMTIGFAGCFIGAIIKAAEYRRNKPKLELKIEQIKSRPKVIVYGNQIHPAP